MKRRRCLVCGAPCYPDPGHECLLYPPDTMRAVYGDDWRTVFLDYDERWRNMKRRLREEVEDDNG